ncbi:2-oxoacid:acceptor oxidoreductase subunit alpha [Patescibacteria group bacterium]|nr:2-oxoacid:acceptor oxidoreductase subunit alpha [Patescibacteria group bacterium]
MSAQFFKVEPSKSSSVDFTWKIGGEAGWGIKSAGLNLSKAFVRGGYHVFSYDEYPSLVRGGHNCYQARISSEKVRSQVLDVDILVALNKETFDLHISELKPHAAVIYDGRHFNLVDPTDKKLRLINIPLREIIKKHEAMEIMMNNVALGATIALVDYDFDILAGIISDQFANKGEEIIKQNIKVARAGYDHFKKNYPSVKLLSLTPLPPLPHPHQDSRLLLTGNEAIALGAVSGGVKFFPAYPMTPASSILHSLAEWAQELGLVVVQTEDEISAVNMAIGGAYSGVRTVTATSGGGFCLMTEGLGLAGMTETPLVIVNAQRPGPATGVPTWTEQGDLRFTLHAHQGTFPRVIAAPGDVAEAFEVTINALNLAEKYQLPVIILTDKLLSESHESTEVFDYQGVKIERGKIHKESQSDSSKYGRYAFTKDGISPRAFPGTANITVRANSDEHDEFGFSTEDSKIRIAMMNKRQMKLKHLDKELPQPRLYGPPQAPLTVVGWGTTKGPILEAQKMLTAAGIPTNFLHFVYLTPFPLETVTKVLNQSKKILDVEGNFDAALAGLIREKTGIEIKEKLLKYDGRPFYPSEIVNRVKSLV